MKLKPKIGREPADASRIAANIEYVRLLWRRSPDFGSRNVPELSSSIRTFVEAGLVQYASASSSGRVTGSDSTRRARTTLYIAVLAPMPIASEQTAMSVNPGERASTRAAWRKSSERPCTARDRGP